MSRTLICLHGSPPDTIVQVGKPYPLHPITDSRDAQYIGCGILFSQGYAANNLYAIFEMPSGKCLTTTADEDFLDAAHEWIEAHFDELIEEYEHG